MNLFKWRNRKVEKKKVNLRRGPISHALASDLTSWRDSLPLAFAAGGAYLSTYGKRSSRARVSSDHEKRMRRLHEDAKIPWHGFHAFRHTFAVRMIRSRKIDVVQLQQLLGHSDITTTQIYLRWDDRRTLLDDARRALE